MGLSILKIFFWAPRSTVQATMGQGSAIGWPLGRFPKVSDFGIFSPLNFAPSADSGQKGPQTGPKIGFGANKKMR